MTDLIKIQEREGQQVVSARELYEFLEVKTEFAKWCERMFEYGFEEDKDFSPLLTKSTGGRPGTDYALTINTAKEIAMLQRSDKGKQARLYFIECEQKMHQTKELVSSAKTVLAQYANDPIIGMRMQQIDMENRLRLVEAKVTTRPEYFTIAGYATLQGVPVSLGTAGKLGRLATQLCKERDYEIEDIPDPRFGRVNSYPAEVLREVFDAYFVK